jgi:phospholipase/carboxylesterase
MTDALKLFQYVAVESEAPSTLFLLHGTGGNEHDLLPLVASLQAEYSQVGLRGNISEQGLTRFFIRTPEGVFDQASIQQETKKLAKFLEAWYKKFGLTAKDVAFVGYSNGANMILAMTLLYPELIHRAVLLHPLLPIKPKKVDLSGKAFLISYGENDQLITPEQTQEVIETLQKFGAKIETVTHPGGHEVKKEEVVALRRFLANK